MLAKFEIFIALSCCTSSWVSSSSGEREYYERQLATILALYPVTNWSGTMLENAAPPEVLQKLTYLVLQHDPLIRRVDTVRAYSLGVLYFAEVQIELPQNLSFKEAHMIGELPQQKIEELEEVERAFVSLDYERDHKPAHKVLNKIPNCV